MTDTIDRFKTSLADRYTIKWELGVGGVARLDVADDLKYRRRGPSSPIDKRRKER
ncbi:MAG: hypothetical protein JSW71_21810 [Gemmatimonadota bacterium]|nr:MAG: hypothetical protein JSW71_21810 [Gemmatimonadota bacterium]